MNKRLNAETVKAQFSRLIDEMAPGEQIEIVRDGRVVAVLERYAREPRSSQLRDRAASS